MSHASSAVLVINCGSSSLKYAVIPSESIPRSARIEGLAEALGTPAARIKGKTAQGEAFTLEVPGGDHAQALEAILQRMEGIPFSAIGHRVVHGGEHFTHAARIDAAVLAAIAQTTPLAPLHNPANLTGIQSTLRLFPDLPQVAVFDTAFHQTLPEHAWRYAVPAGWYTEHRIRRYGFHGTSHRYVSQLATSLTLNENVSTGPFGWLVAHLGNGCSTCAVWDGKSLDTSMGLTPLEGLVMGTRSGDIDPGIPAHLQRTLGWSLADIDIQLNRHSGLLGLSGLSNDMRTLTEAAAQGHAGAVLAIEVFCYRLAKSLAALSCALPEIHGLIFTGGIGENAPLIREKTLRLLSHLGFHLDAQANLSLSRGSAGRIELASSTPRAIWVIPTDEEAQIAAETCALLEASPLH